VLRKLSPFKKRPPKPTGDDGPASS
jgi:hypothetical protein